MATKIKRPSIVDFNTKIRVQVAYTNTNKVRLLVSADNLALMNDTFGDDTTEDTWCFVWLLYANKKLARTTEVRQKIKALRRMLEKVIAAICNDIPVSVWTYADRDTYDRKTGAHAAPELHTEPMTDLCYVLLKALGGGGVNAKCRTNEDSSRASKPAMADAVEIAWRIDPPEPDPENVGKTKFYRIKAPNDGTTLKIYTKASFTGNLGAENAGSLVQGYARWTNTKHPNLASFWTGPYSIILT